MISLARKKQSFYSNVLLILDCLLKTRITKNGTTQHDSSYQALRRLTRSCSLGAVRILMASASESLMPVKNTCSRQNKNFARKA